MKFIVLLFFLFSIGSEASAQPKANFQKLSQGRLAFSYKEDQSWDIYVLDFKKGSLSPLITTQANERSPSWSPDGQTLAYTSDGSSGGDIYTINANNKDIRRLTFDPQENLDPDFSPDGKKILFRRKTGAFSSAIFALKITGQEQVKQQITKTIRKHVYPRWSPRGEEFLFGSNQSWPGWDIFIYNLKNGNTQALTKGQKSFTRPSWRPDGGAFAFSYGSGDDIDIWIQEKGGAAPYEVASTPGRDLDVEWDHTGEFLFFVSDALSSDASFQIFLYEISSAEMIKLTHGKGSVRNLSWTPLPLKERNK